MATPGESPAFQDQVTMLSDRLPSAGTVVRPLVIRSSVWFYASILTTLVGTTSTAQPPNLGEAKSQLTAYHDFGNYDRDLEAVAAQAAAYLSEHAAGTKKPAIVFDIDDTALSTWEAIVANDFGY